MPKRHFYKHYDSHDNYMSQQGGTTGDTAVEATFLFNEPQSSSVAKCGRGNL
jgi:hypothetical protein